MWCFSWGLGETPYGETQVGCWRNASGQDKSLPQGQLTVWLTANLQNHSIQLRLVFILKLDLMHQMEGICFGPAGSSARRIARALKMPQKAQPPIFSTLINFKLQPSATICNLPSAEALQHGPEIAGSHEIQAADHSGSLAPGDTVTGAVSICK